MISINKFLTNNELAKSIISQYIGIYEHLKNIFTNIVLKEYKKIVKYYSSIEVWLNREKYCNIIKKNYGIHGNHFYIVKYLAHKNKLYYKLGLATQNIFISLKYFVSKLLIPYDATPPSMIIQLNYFD